MTAKRDHVVLVNFNKREPIRTLESDPDILLTVVTEPYFKYMYAEDTTIVPVDDFSDDTKILHAVLKAGERAPIDHVVTPSEFHVLIGGQVRSILGLDGPGYDITNNFCNKYVAKRKVAAAGIPVARHILVQHPGGIADAADRLGWPVVVKPAMGAGSLGVAVLRGREELDQVVAGQTGDSWRAFWGPLLVEKYVPIETEYHCDGLVQDGKVRFAEVSQYVIPMLPSVGGMVCSFTLDPRSDRRSEIEDMHRTVVGALGLEDGVTHMEVMAGPDGLVFGEIACRPAGGRIVRNVELARNVDLWRCFIDLSIGRTPQVEPTPPDGVSLLVQFPTLAGRVTYITPSDELAAVPGCRDVNLHVSVGDRTRAANNTSAHAAAIMLSVDDESSVPAGIKSVRDVFRMEVEPIPAK